MLGGYKESMEIEYSPKIWPIELAKQSSYGFTYTVEACNGHVGVCKQVIAVILFLWYS